MASLVSPIVDIILRLWNCCARHTRYLRKLQQNKILLSTAMDELKEARDDVQRRVVEEEADLNEPKKRTDPVRGWLERVQIIEGGVEEILQKADEQLSKARCLGGCCPPNNCWSNYKVGKSTAKKIPLVDVLKEKGHFEKVTYRLSPSFVEEHTSYLCKLQDNKLLLRSALEELKNLRNDVQRKVVEAEADQSELKKRTDQVGGWLRNVEIIEGEVEVILQEEDEQLSSARFHEKDKLVVMKKAYVDELKGKGRFEELTYRLPPPSVQDMNLELTVGMESMFDKVWRFLTCTDDKIVRIMGLYGQGGVGKTTLLKQINKEFHKISGEHGFDYFVIFVVVSKPINYETIQKKIGERLGLSDSLKEDGDEDSKAQKIFNALSNKNYVLLLDDIWEEVDKKRIGIPIYPQGNSKLIFTTRSERVCGEMKADKKFKVECLPRNEAWRLFKQNVGEEALNYFPTARELAKVVAEECDGLPLALIALGKAMSTKKSAQEWRDAKITLRRYASEFKDMGDKVLPRLKLSYDNLPNETEKSCFRYCAIFPEDYSIQTAKLVELWIAEGILDGIDNLDEARDRGHTIIGSLKSACLLESSGEDRVKMHDVFRDLALWIVNDCRSSDESGSNSDNKFLVAANKPCKKWENAERIFWDADNWDADSITSNNNEEKKPPISPNLLTLIVRKNWKMMVFNEYDDCTHCLPQSFFQDMPLLRVLDLSNAHCFDGEFPISICELHELQYLNLSGTFIKKLPVELRKLVKLKFLVLKNTYWLRRIPAGLIANLSELQVLDLGSSLSRDNPGVEDWELEYGPSFSELDGLKQLQEVRITISTTYVAFDKFLCNRKLQMTCTGLRFKLKNSYKSSSSSSSSSSRRVLNLRNFKSLKDLELDGRTTDGGFLESEELVLLSNLETIKLHCFPMLNSILWMAAPPDFLHSHFQSLQYIQIAGCHALKDLTWLVYVQNLKTLHVQDCKGLETIIELGDDHGLEGGAKGGDQILLNTGGRVFRRLKKLLLEDLQKLKSICRHALAFPSIETIAIFQCPELKKLPLGSGSNANNTLKRIRGRTEWWNELEWEDETIKSKFLPYFDKKTYLPLDLKPPFGDGINFDSAKIGDDSEGEFSSEWSLHHLKCVEFKWVLGCVNELKFLQVVLKHSLVLEKLLIAAYEFVTGKHKLLKKF